MNKLVAVVLNSKVIRCSGLFICAAVWGEESDCVYFPPGHVLVCDLGQITQPFCASFYPVENGANKLIVLLRIKRAMDIK